MRPQPSPVEDLLRDPLILGSFRIADAPIRYRAIEAADRRFAWTVPPFLRPRSPGVMPQHYALTLELSTFGIWSVVEAKGFEWPEDAERWARALWRDAVASAPVVRRPGETRSVEPDGAARDAEEPAA